MGNPSCEYLWCIDPLGLSVNTLYFRNVHTKDASVVHFGERFILLLFCIFMDRLYHLFVSQSFSTYTMLFLGSASCIP